MTTRKGHICLATGERSMRITLHTVKQCLTHHNTGHQWHITTLCFQSSGCSYTNYRGCKVKSHAWASKEFPYSSLKTRGSHMLFVKKMSEFNNSLKNCCIEFWAGFPIVKAISLEPLSTSVGPALHAFPKLYKFNHIPSPRCIGMQSKMSVCLNNDLTTSSLANAKCFTSCSFLLPSFHVHAHYVRF